MKSLKRLFKSRFRIRENIKIVHLDKDGNAKPIFQENKLFTFLLKRAIVKETFPKIPFLLGKWAFAKNISNLITNAGFAGVASRINGDGAEAAFTYIAVGTGTNAANVTDTTLQTESTDSGLSRAAATASRVTTDVSNDTAQLVKTFSVTGTKAITESGMFNASSAGALLARQTFSAVNVVDGDSLQMTWKADVD